MKQPPTRTDPEPRWLIAAAAMLIAVFVGLATSSLLSESQTSDEAIHLAAGFAYITRADFYLNPEHPPLAKEIAALPLLLLDVKLPFDHPSWKAAHAGAFQLPLGEQFLYHNGTRFETILTAGRMPIVCLGAALCLTVFVLARRMFGWRAALVSLALCVFCPNLLAHARLVTTDLAVSFFLVLTLLCLHRYLTAPGLAGMALAGACIGLTLASKFSAVVLVPAVLLVLLMAPSGSRRLDPLAALKAFSGMMAAAIVVLAATYGFIHLPIYVSGLSSVFTTVTGGTEAFLLGSYSSEGWWYYYPVAMLLKTPVVALLAFAAIPLCYAGGKMPDAWKHHLVLLIPLFMFGAASLASARNVGLRHVLPVYPILYLLAGQAISLLASWPGWGRRALLGVMGAWLLGSTLFIHPSYLAYVNEIGGGPSRGWKLLSDSNVDWGQDFFRLGRFMKEQGVEEILLAHYGNQDPAYYGITYQYLPGMGHIKAPPARVLRSDRVLLAISVMTLQGMFMPDKGAYRWLQERTPLARAGYSIYIYDVTGDDDAYRKLAEIYARNRLRPQAQWAEARVGAR
jgi:hypothetical protein